MLCVSLAISSVCFKVSQSGSISIRCILADMKHSYFCMSPPFFKYQRSKTCKYNLGQNQWGCGATLTHPILPPTHASYGHERTRVSVSQGTVWGWHIFCQKIRLVLAKVILQSIWFRKHLYKNLTTIDMWIIKKIKNTL